MSTVTGATRRDVANEEPKAARFEQVIYWITANRDDFDVPRFKASLPSAVRNRDDLAVLIGSKDEAETPYHALFGWTISDEEIDLNIEYYAGPLRHLDGDSPHGDDTPDRDVDGPPAEELMRWLGEFFTVETVTAHAHVRYRYPAESREATFELKLATNAPLGAKLYGVALHLPTKPDGVVSVRLTRGGSDWYAELIGDRDLTFRNFSPIEETDALQTFITAFIREKTS
jgi:hypothetical protein